VPSRLRFAVVFNCLSVELFACMDVSLFGCILVASDGTMMGKAVDLKLRGARFVVDMFNLKLVCVFWC
jgi:hypothetical protein